MRATKKLPSSNASTKTRQRVVQDNVLKPQGRLCLECLNYHKRAFSNEVGVVSQCHEKVWEIKKVDETLIISHQHKK
jgi:hypothetical protein